LMLPSKGRRSSEGGGVRAPGRGGLAGQTTGRGWRAVAGRRGSAGARRRTALRGCGAPADFRRAAVGRVFGSCSHCRRPSLPQPLQAAGRGREERAKISEILRGRPKRWLRRSMGSPDSGKRHARRSRTERREGIGAAPDRAGEQTGKRAAGAGDRAHGARLTPWLTARRWRAAADRRDAAEAWEAFRPGAIGGLPAVGGAGIRRRPGARGDLPAAAGKAKKSGWVGHGADLSIGPAS